MLKFETNRLDIESELLDEVKLFYPYFDEQNLSIKHTYFSEISDKIKVVNRVEIDGKIYEFSAEFDNNLPELERKRVDKRACKTAIFNALKSFSKKEIPWGSLTGIRPSKLVYDLLEEGFDIDTAKQKMQERFSVSKRKSELICDIVKNQNGYYKKDGKLINLYVHIPFCTTKCNYCSFVTEPLHRVKNLVPEYVKLLREEISRSLDFINSNGKLFSVYVGGGTPTALTAEQIYTLFNGFPFQDIEFTIEAGRPDTIDAEKLDAIKAVGANRICVNPQTLVNRTLALIGRAHSAEDFMEKYALAKSYGFDINVDIIAGLNGENLDDFIYTTDGIVALSPENITVHTLSRKNGSALKNGGKFDNGEVEKMVDYAYAKIVESGYLPYYLYRQKQMLGNLENVGYCKSGKQCANNITTMEDCVSVVACGAGAISKIVLPEQNRIERFANMRDLRLYMQTFDEKLKDKLFFYEKQFTKQY